MTTTEPDEADGHPDSVWVSSDRTVDDYYVATVHPSSDVSIPLTAHQAVAYAITVLRAVADAEYDAAVLAQITTATGGDQHAAAATVMQLREARPPRDTAPTAPLVFTPIVSKANGHPFVLVHLHGQALTQWTPEDARGHAQHVLDVAIVADHDAAYLHYLTSVVALEPERARVAVDALRQHRHNQPTTQEGTTDVH